MSRPPAAADGAPLASRLQRAWLGRGPLACALWPLSLLYGALAFLRRSAYRRGWRRARRMPVPVVVVGNVVAGGAGKTPVAIALVRHLQAQGRRPGVVSRGYGRRTGGCRAVQADSAALEVGDEPLLIHRATGAPLVVARRRAEAAEALLAAHPEVDIIVCDDGLQHLALARDVEVVVFDDRGAGNGWLLPTGPLREPWPRRPAAGVPQLLLHTGVHPAFAGWRAPRALARHAVRADGSRVALADLRGQPVQAVAGIAYPEGFFSMLRSAGVQPAYTLGLADHADFTGWQPPAGGALPLLCTEKDAVKLWATHPQALAVPLECTPEPAFLAALDAALVPLSSGAASPPHPTDHG
ncbi:tetraacyldisaccharide 4'-kinase [Xylophilus sp.]|uniref:tetraacyldisaccharide 4'-kinase n=1 Tax=Xylophilus sp. TaxID=2653893 RepID=UPI0013BD1AB2|nr:tetraacyldisaccharide 4'-kinase [Xylophilus sp.]KAF1044935.1 MAG: Tetraacyldisaccharide 4'-kinase [Xylophilus sp.]